MHGIHASSRACGCSADRYASLVPPYGAPRSGAEPDDYRGARVAGSSCRQRARAGRGALGRFLQPRYDEQDASAPLNRECLSSFGRQSVDTVENAGSVLAASVDNHLRALLRTFRPCYYPARSEIGSLPTLFMLSSTVQRRLGTVRRLSMGPPHDTAPVGPTAVPDRVSEVVRGFHRIPRGLPGFHNGRQSSGQRTPTMSSVKGE